MKSMNRWSELSLRLGKKLRNRVVVPPMASQNADELGYVTNKTLEHYRRLAESCPGLLIVEYTFVHLSGRSEDNQLGISEDDQVPGLTELAHTIHASGALAGIQITHGGGKSERELAGGVLMGASAIAVPVKDRELEIPEPMTRAQIDFWRRSFLAAAGRASHAGFDLLELHSAHGYGLNQFLSPITNQRADEYGRNLHGRMKLLLEIITSIRKYFPELLLSVRMPGQDFIPGGLSNQDCIQVARELEKAGVDLIHISSGVGGWRRPGNRVGEGYLVAEASQIAQAVQIPVIGVGGIETGEYIDRELNQGSFSLAAIGRAILADPSGWSRRNLCLREPRPAIHDSLELASAGVDL